MGLEIKEADWKLFRQLHQIALERFCHRTIEELCSVTSKCADGYHACFLEVFALIQERNEELARTFDDIRRSTAIILLANMKEQDLLSEEEFSRFNSETRDAVNGILHIRSGQ